MKEFEIALLIVSLLTSLITEAVKKLMDEFETKYKPNILATCISIITSAMCILVYVFYFNVSITNQFIASSFALIVMSFLCATVGYDKVKQTINQVLGKTS